MYFRELPVLFQNRTIPEVGLEALLAIVINRLLGFQSGPFPSRENAIALTHCEDALNWLQKRRAIRIARSVEGKCEI